MQALRCHDLVHAIGVNTHIGYANLAAPYADPTLAIRCLNYLGVKLFRDGAGDAKLFRLVATATGTRMIGMIGESPPANYGYELGALLTLGPLLAAVEGPNEPDSAYAQSVGSSPAAAAAFQPTLYASARALGIPAIVNSFGVIWPNPGSYGTTGDLSAWCDYANAHTYYDPHQCGPNGNGFYNTGMIDWIARAAGLTAPGRPVAHTEFGWQRSHNSDQAIAQYVLTFLLSAHAQWGSPLAIIYGMFDDISGTWGLFNNDASPRPVATGVRNLIQFFDDAHANAATFAPAALALTVTGLPSGENLNAGGRYALYQYACGDYVVALWNDQRLTTEDAPTTPPNTSVAVAPVAVTVTLQTPATSVYVFDPLGASRSIGGALSFTVQVPAHPLLVRLRF